MVNEIGLCLEYCLSWILLHRVAVIRPKLTNDCLFPNGSLDLSWMISEGRSLCSVKDSATIWTLEMLCAAIHLTVLCGSLSVKKKTNSLKVFAVCAQWIHMCFFINYVLKMALVESVTLYGFVPFVSRTVCGFSQPIVACISLALNEKQYVCCFWFSSINTCATLLQIMSQPSCHTLSLHLPFACLCGNPDTIRYLILITVFLCFIETVGLFVMHLQMNLDFFPVNLL